jgi:hypothetical protein
MLMLVLVLQPAPGPSKAPSLSRPTRPGRPGLDLCNLYDVRQETRSLLLLACMRPPSFPGMGRYDASLRPSRRRTYLSRRTVGVAVGVCCPATKSMPASPICRTRSVPRGAAEGARAVAPPAPMARGRIFGAADRRVSETRPRAVAIGNASRGRKNGASDVPSRPHPA